MLMMRSSILGAAIVLIVISGAALAQEKGGAAADSAAEARAKARAACAADAEKFCAGVERGKGGGMRACFVAHETELSAECKAARTERGALRGKDRS
jgi:hypothetical protein